VGHGDLNLRIGKLRMNYYTSVCEVKMTLPQVCKDEARHFLGAGFGARHFDGHLVDGSTLS